jgi:hypothetical protein
MPAWNFNMGSAPLWGPDPRQEAQRLSDYRQWYTQNTWLGQQQQQAEDEGRRRLREMEDRAYQLQVQAATRQRDMDRATIGNQKAQQKYQNALLQISREKMANDERWKQAEVTGYHGGTPTFAREQWAESAAMNRANMAAQLRGPEDWVAYKQLTSGVQGGSPTIPGVGNWNTGGQTGMTAFAPGAQATPITLQKIMSDMGVSGTGPMGAPGTGQPTFNAAEQQVMGTANTFAMNPHQAAGGWLENQDPNTVAMLKGAAEKQGHDWNSVMDRYKRSRWGGGEGDPRAA